MLKVISWKRYINDVFLLWKGEVTILHKFLQFLNMNFDGLKISLTFNMEEIHFGIYWYKKKESITSHHLYI